MCGLIGNADRKGLVLSSTTFQLVMLFMEVKASSTEHACTFSM